MSTFTFKTKKTKMIIILISIFFTSLLCQCTDNKKDTEIASIKVDIENKTTCFIDEIATDVLCSNLELPNDLFLGEITDIVGLSDSLLLFHDFYSKRIHLFTQTGKWINTLNKQGRGHGEYFDIESFAIDRFNSQLIIYDHSGKKFVYYSIPAFEYSKKEPTKKSLMAFSLITPNKMLIISDEVESKTPEKTICEGPILYDLETNEFEKYHFDNFSSSIYLSYPRTLSLINNQYYYAYPDANSIVYKFTSKGEIESLIRFNFGNKRGNQTFWECSDILEFNDILVDNEYALMPHFFTFSKELYAFFFINGDAQQASNMALCSRNSEKSFVYEDIKLRGIEMPPLRPVGVLNESYICFIYPSACEFDEEEIQKSPISQLIAEKLKAAKDKETPILFTFTPKLPV